MSDDHTVAQLADARRRAEGARRHNRRARLCARLGLAAAGFAIGAALFGAALNHGWFGP